MRSVFEVLKRTVFDRDLLEKDSLRRASVYQFLERKFAQIKKEGGEFSVFAFKDGELDRKSSDVEQIKLFIQDVVCQKPDENTWGDPVVWESFKSYFDRGCVIPQKNPIPTKVKGVTMEVYADPLDVCFKSTGNSSK